MENILEQDNIKIYYHNLPEVLEIKNEIFSGEYRRILSHQPKYIIDCGSYIGISVLWFKQQYPEVEILAFEPHPINFQLLYKNITVNKLQNVKVIQAAVQDQQQELEFYGEFNASDPELSTCGNSIVPSWGKRNTNEPIKVQGLLLSSYIDRPVDLLKLDVEGAEFRVLNDLAVSKKLTLIREIILEFHTTKDDQSNNPLAIRQVLEKNGFKIASILHKNLKDAFPPELHQWIEAQRFQMGLIHAYREA